MMMVCVRVVGLRLPSSCCGSPWPPHRLSSLGPLLRTCSRSHSIPIGSPSPPSKKNKMLHAACGGLQDAKGVEGRHDQREQESIRNSNRPHLGIHNRQGWQACSYSHLGHVCTWTRTRRLLLHQSNATRGKHYPRDAEPPLAVRQQHFDSAHPTPRGQGRMLLRRISSHPGRHGLHIISAFCTSCSTGKQRRQSRRSHLHRDPRILHQLQHSHGAHHDGNAPTEEGVRAVCTEYFAIQKKCTPTGGNNTPEEATLTETERQHAQIPDITPKEAIVTGTERFCALVQVVLHYSPGDAYSTMAGRAPDVPHHETVSATPNPRVEDTFNNAHATETSGTKPPTMCVEFSCTERNPFRISEGKNRAIND